MSVRIRYRDGNLWSLELLTADEVRYWVGPTGRPVLDDPAVARNLPLFLQHWDKVYDAADSEMFLRHLTLWYVPQLELLAGIRDLGETIVRRFPVESYLHIGISRNVTPILAYLNSLQPIPVVPQPTPERAGDAGGRRILLIDYAGTGAAYSDARDLLGACLDGASTGAVEVHALAIWRGDIEESVRQPDWGFDSWHTLPIVEQGLLPTERQLGVIRLLAGRTGRLLDIPGYVARAGSERISDPTDPSAYSLLRQAAGYSVA